MIKRLLDHVMYINESPHIKINMVRSIYIHPYNYGEVCKYWKDTSYLSKYEKD